MKSPLVGIMIAAPLIAAYMLSTEYLKRYARQSHESGDAKTFVAVPLAEPTRILGYYSISPGAIEFAQVPPKLAKKAATRCPSFVSLDWRSA